MFSAGNFFTDAQKKLIVDAITEAEQATSGEIRVHIENFCLGDPVKRAQKVFVSLEIAKTELKNGVLFYLAVNSKKFSIIGDSGIYNLVPHNFWDSIKNKMAENFHNGNFTEGLCEGIKAAGDQLKVHFPFMHGDKNELSNDISFGK